MYSESVSSRTAGPMEAKLGMLVGGGQGTLVGVRARTSSPLSA